MEINLSYLRFIIQDTVPYDSTYLTLYRKNIYQ
jgi:hypothetical protein